MARHYVSFFLLVDIMGEPDALALCREHGGLPLYVAQTPERSSLAGLLSPVAIESLCAEFGGEEIQLSSSPLHRPPIKQRLAAMLEAGASLSVAARTCGCSARYAHYVRRDLGISSKRRVPKKPKILAALREGLPPREIAGKFEVSVDYVYSLRSEYGIPRPEAPQDASTGTDGEA